MEERLARDPQIKLQDVLVVKIVAGNNDCSLQYPVTKPHGIHFSKGAAPQTLVTFQPHATDLWSHNTEGVGGYGNLPVNLILGLFKMVIHGSRQ